MAANPGYCIPIPMGFKSAFELNLMIPVIKEGFVTSFSMTGEGITHWQLTPKGVELAHATLAI